MDTFWLDASVVIQAKRGAYAFDLARPFWDFLESEIKAGLLKTVPLLVDELVPKVAADRDDLALWILDMKKHGLIEMPSSQVVLRYRSIADYVYENCDRAECDAFLDDADPWLIAHAKENGVTVLTEEKPVSADSSKIKIPNICTVFGVPYMRTVDYLRYRKFSFK